MDSQQRVYQNRKLQMVLFGPSPETLLLIEF
ncbi:uncharacterized protein G2W53_001025 [Senna tora]|uniref:Uncharacterized protein n=1 Tax=Senna tora TaxID=362788 RepID=A0A834XET3_9FABA|nr:uncharacterized protein G2W53_001025 [Senna tora]